MVRRVVEGSFRPGRVLKLYPLCLNLRGSLLVLPGEWCGKVDSGRPPPTRESRKGVRLGPTDQVLRTQTDPLFVCRPFIRVHRCRGAEWVRCGVILDAPDPLRDMPHESRDSIFTVLRRKSLEQVIPFWSFVSVVWGLFEDCPSSLDRYLATPVRGFGRDRTHGSTLPKSTDPSS